MLCLGCNIYVVGGVSTQTGEGVDTIEVLDCDTATWEEENEEENGFPSIVPLDGQSFNGGFLLLNTK